MKAPKLLLLIAAGTLGLVVLAGLRASRSRSGEPLAAPAGGDATAVPSPYGSPPSAPGSSAPEAASVPAQLGTQTPEQSPEPGSATEDLLRVRSDEVLATVNQQAIRLKDLVALGSGEKEKLMTKEEYDLRLNLAIDMQLTFQAARAEGVDLTAEQRQRLNKLGTRSEAEAREDKRQGIWWSSITPEQTAFEKQVTSALLLQQDLVASKAGAVPSPDAAEQARFEQARRNLLAQLKTAANISLSIPGR